MSQRRNLSRTVNSSSKNPSTNDRRFRTSVSRDSNESILSERFTFTILSSLSYVESNVKKEHEKKELINSKDVNVQLIKL